MASKGMKYNGDGTFTCPIMGRGKPCIEPKRDFGGHPFLIAGRSVSSGFVVTLNGANVMPGATWFETIPEAERGIAALARHPEGGTEFWDDVRSLQASQK